MDHLGGLLVSATKFLVFIVGLVLVLLGCGQMTSNLQSELAGKTAEFTLVPGFQFLSNDQTAQFTASGCIEPCTYSITPAGKATVGTTGLLTPTPNTFGQVTVRLTDKNGLFREANIILLGPLQFPSTLSLSPTDTYNFLDATIGFFGTPYFSIKTIPSDIQATINPLTGLFSITNRTVPFSTSDILVQAEDSSGRIKTSLVHAGSQIVHVGSGANDYTQSVLRDSANNVFITGKTLSSFDHNTYVGGEDIFVVKFDSNGNKLWSKQLGSLNDDTIDASVLDSTNSIYVAGNTTTSFDGNSAIGSQDVFLVKFDSNGNKLWSKQLGSLQVDAVNALAVDSNNNVYMTGYSTGSFEGGVALGGEDAVVLKLDSNGNILWVKQLGGVSNERNSNIVIDASNNAYVANYSGGTYQGIAGLGQSDIFISKFDLNGNILWSSGIGSNQYEYTYQMILDPSNNIYISGYTMGNFDGHTLIGGNDLFVAKFDTNGNKLWSNQIGSTAAEHPYELLRDSVNNFVLVGYTQGVFDSNTALGNADAFVYKFDANGNKIWSKLYGGDSSEYIRSAFIDGSNNIYIAGTTGGSFEGHLYTSTNFNDELFVAKLDPNGSKIWTSQQAAYGGWVELEHIFLDSTGTNFFGSGYTSGFTYTPLNRLNEIFLFKKSTSTPPF